MMHLFAVTVVVEASSAAEAIDVFTPIAPKAIKPAPTMVSRHILLTWANSPHRVINITEGSVAIFSLSG